MKEDKVIELVSIHFKEEEFRVSRALEIAVKDIEEAKISTNLNFNFYEILNAIKFLDESSEMYEYYIKLLSLSLINDTQNKNHPSFLITLKSINIDEMNMLKNINLNNYEFISTYDYENGKGFFNYKQVKFDYPKEELLTPANFDFYIHHLQDALKLIRWPIYNQQAIFQMGVQTGTTKYSKLVTTVTGKKFISCFI